MVPRISKSFSTRACGCAGLRTASTRSSCSTTSVSASRRSHSASRASRSRWRLAHPGCEIGGRRRRQRATARHCGARRRPPLRPLGRPRARTCKKRCTSCSTVWTNSGLCSSRSLPKCTLCRRFPACTPRAACRRLFLVALGSGRVETALRWSWIGEAERSTVPAALLGCQGCRASAACFGPSRGDSQRRQRAHTTRISEAR
mmetsp:Transcript_101312/g.285694  ORF Transcript_101312/g.285694 Transcript_101312/m.285694 type:complete len:202 (-) Transcript_101312:245-850(-)